uniref:Phosphoesterase n=1 Tax=Byssovorax cruenta TaxID=293647 RepID=A0A3S5GXY2_9BACT|nr:phosphoesterase [Byssovorax cruenta]
MALTLALITDLHFGPEAHFGGKLRKLTGQADALARAFVARMNERDKPDIIVNLGDDIEDEGPDEDRARYARCLSILSEARAELVNVAGNHDTVHQSTEDLRAAWARAAGHGGAPLTAPHLTAPHALPPEGQLYHSFDRGGFHFIVLHTRERKDLDVSIGPEQLAWLEADLAIHPGPVVVLMHHSAADQDLRGNRWFEGSPHICLVRERRAIRALFARHGAVRAVFNGHLHWNHLDVIDGIPFVTVQSLIENLDDDVPGRPAAAHALVRLEPRRVVVEVEGAERARYQFDIRKG